MYYRNYDPRYKFVWSAKLSGSWISQVRPFDRQRQLQGQFFEYDESVFFWLCRESWILNSLTRERWTWILLELWDIQNYPPFNIKWHFLFNLWLYALVLILLNFFHIRFSFSLCVLPSIKSLGFNHYKMQYYNDKKKYKLKILAIKIQYVQRLISFKDLPISDNSRISLFNRPNRMKMRDNRIMCVWERSVSASNIYKIWNFTRSI